MLKDLYPIKILFMPSATFSEAAAGKTGWFWPLAICSAATLASSLLLCRLPPEFMVEITGGAKLILRNNFWFYLSIGLTGGLGFTLFFCALLTSFLPFIKSGRLPVRLACLALGTAAYGFFFLLPFKGAAAYTVATRLLVFLAAGFSVRAVLINRLLYSRLVKTVLSLSLITLLADAAGAASVLAGSVSAYNFTQYCCALLALAYLVKAAAIFFNTTTARAAAALLPAMLASAAFLFSLSALGLLSPEIFQTLMLI